MKRPEKYFCDMCGTEITSTSGFKNQRMPVVTEFEWTEGHPKPPHVDTLQMDLCMEAATALSTLQAENEKLRGELEQVKRERDAAVERLREWEKFDIYLLAHNFLIPEKWRGIKEG